MSDWKIEEGEKIGLVELCRRMGEIEEIVPMSFREKVLTAVHQGELEFTGDRLFALPEEEER